ncbi:MAG: UDP-N-acetylmuramoyl-L-alanine--D-glutamate ligase [Gammaproteobacteria bacterium]|nr:UDP-N-acetylmuramoyl-L-alanine--D-glutamate ligase [Gammaproteobacteria bacterium]
MSLHDDIFTGRASRVEPNISLGRRGVVTVVGLGKTGLSCVRYLRRAGREVRVMDSRSDPPGLAALGEEFPEVSVTLGAFDASKLGEADQIVLSPGVALATPALADAIRARVPICGDIEIFAEAAGRTPVVAITGSNGKSTVTAMVADMLAADGRAVKAGGNIGTPALELLEGPAADIYVLELSSFQLETTASLHPQAAALLNVSADHMDRYPDVEAYAAAKQRIFRGHGTMVLNRDDPRVAAMAAPGRRVVLYTLSAPLPGQWGLRRTGGELWLCQGETRIVRADALKVAGLHNAANALAAMALAAAVGVSHDAMARALEAFRALPHRCELVAEAAGVRWYDDSKATNVGATIASIRGLAHLGPIVLIAGGDGKGADFAQLRDAVRDHVRLVIFIGRDGPRLAEAVADVAETLPARGVADAVRVARAHAHAGDTVLLAPACASFDMYRDYVERGEAFVAEVRAGAGA